MREFGRAPKKNRGGIDSPSENAARGGLRITYEYFLDGKIFRLRGNLRGEMTARNFFLRGAGNIFWRGALLGRSFAGRGGGAGDVGAQSCCAHASPRGIQGAGLRGPAGVELARSLGASVGGPSLGVFSNPGRGPLKGFRQRRNLHLPLRLIAFADRSRGGC